MIAIGKEGAKSDLKAAVESLSSKKHKEKAKRDAAKKMTSEKAARLKKAGIAK